MPPYDRTALTEWLIAQLAGDTQVFLGVAGPDVGWSDASGNPAQPGQPGAHYVPYATLTPGVASTNLRAPLDDDTGSWIQPYSLLVAGGVPDQAEHVAHGLRVLVAAVPKRVKLDLGGPWGVLKVVPRQLGALARSDATNPPSWAVTDTLEVWLERARSL